MTTNTGDGNFQTFRQTVVLPIGFNSETDSSLLEASFARQVGRGWTLVDIDAERAVFEMQREMTTPAPAKFRDGDFQTMILPIDFDPDKDTAALEVKFARQFGRGWTLVELDDRKAVFQMQRETSNPASARVRDTAVKRIAGIIAGVRFMRQTYGRRSR